MKNKFNLSIQNPCTENYNNFSPTETGGFCSSCQKEVIDFTDMTSKEIIKYFKNNNAQKTCGRFHNYQLTTYNETKENHKTQSFLSGIGLAFISLFMPNQTNAQNCKPSVEKLASTSKNSRIKILQQENIIKGYVYDNSGSLPGVSVILENTTIGTETDFDGHFEFPQPLQNGDVLVFSFIGMKSEKITISNVNQTLSILMKEDEVLLGELVFVGEVAVKKLFTSKKKK
ncbi:CarboxypepD_reg-like domain-containing protein [Tenacibaculum sp. 190524A02b]|uniref:CarboxypepD_reg-like domain-containing protein n=1 Tax=Tenacibaculum vairaonense TaxID=3137860 RepID=A0ABP1FI40_9FLAO